MRLQHAKLAASGLPTDEPGHKEAKATIVTEDDDVLDGSAKLVAVTVTSAGEGIAEGAV